MGFIIFLVLCLNVIGFMCGGNSNWSELVPRLRFC